MKTCIRCNTANNDEVKFCLNCGMNLSQPQFIQNPQTFFSAKKEISWFDISSIIGFASAICGIFWCSIIMLPIGAVFSMLGLSTNKSKIIPVAGLIISLIGGFVRIGIILYKLKIVPEWFIEGIF